MMADVVSSQVMGSPASNPWNIINYLIQHGSHWFRRSILLHWPTSFLKAEHVDEAVT